MNRVLAVFGATVSVAMGSFAAAPLGWSEPVGPAGEQDSVVAEVNGERLSPPATLTDVETFGNPVSDACEQFGAALAVAAANYEDFAYATAGSGNYVDYRDPTVGRSNMVGRTALREAAAAALSAAGTPGLPPEVASPMRAWSLHATKLLVVMGLHGGGDRLNSSANQLNADAGNAQTACAVALQGG